MRFFNFILFCKYNIIKRRREIVKVVFVGGDIRQKIASDYLNEHHIDSIYISHPIDIDLKNYASVLVLPLPVSPDGVHLNTNNENKTKIKINDIINQIGSDSLVLGGKFQKEIKESMQNNNLRYVDYYDIETFQIQNALLTAEGAIYYAKNRMSKSIHSSCVAVLGFGRIGKILAYLCRSQGAKTTVYARGEVDRIWSKVAGIKALKIDSLGIDEPSKIDIIFNTIPHNIINENILNKIQKDTLVIDLASKPFGIDEELVKKNNLNYYRELGVPGRYAPKSAGEILGQTIINILNKEG